MCEVLHPDMTPHSTNTRRKSRRAGGEVRRPRAVVRDRAGVHLLPVRPAAGLARGRVPRSAGPVLLRRRRRQDARPRDRRAPHGGLHEGRTGHRGHQRRGDDGAVGVPDRRPPAAAHRRPAVGGPLAALPHRRGLRRVRHPRAQAGARATGTAPGRTPTSRPRPCARTAAGTPSSPAARRSGSGSTSTSSNYGIGIESRLTGAHETAHYTKFSYGTSDRGASIRIPWQVAKNKKGWIEDRRPNANMDPYVVSGLMVETVCGAAAGD